MNVYMGKDGYVTVNGEDLPMCLNIVNHSPTGFAWGYFGSGPAQLALAILCNEYGKDLNEHPVHYQAFKTAVISKLPPRFTLTDADIKGWVETYRERQAELLEQSQIIKSEIEYEKAISKIEKLLSLESPTYEQLEQIKSLVCVIQKYESSITA